MRRTWTPQLFWSICTAVVTFSWSLSAGSPCVTLAGHQGECATLRDCLAFHATSPKSLKASQGKYDPKQCRAPQFCCPGLDLVTTTRIDKEDSPTNKSLPELLSSSEENKGYRANSDTLTSTTARPSSSASPLPVTFPPFVIPDLFLRPVAPLSRLSAPVPVSMDHPKVPMLEVDKCGVSSVEYIVGGKHAARGQFPWMVLICYNSTDGDSLGCLCGGSLITKRYILTAAHCVTNMATNVKLASVKVGEHDESTDPDCDFSSKTECSPPVQIIPIERATPHPGYSRPLNLHDIALIRLARDVELSDFVCPVCLPLGDIQLKNIDNVTQLIVAGWGRTQDVLLTAEQSSVLQFVGVPAVANAKCTAAYRMRRVIRPSQLCAGGAKEDSCSGDSGGPLVMPDAVPGDDDPRMVQVGVVSFGPKACGTIGTPGVYTRVGFYMDWILSNLMP